MMMNFPIINLYPDFFPVVNAADIDVVEGAAGPGRRLCIWLQGCLKQCPGCINQTFLPVVPKKLFPVEELLYRIDAFNDLDGISLSGGEPVLQAKALVPFLQEVQKRGLSVVCYTGCRLEELTARGAPKPLNEFLSCIDLLIDGEYRADLPRGGMYCVSSNQRLHFLSQRIKPKDIENQPENALSFDPKKLKWTGTIPDEICLKIINKLKTYGVYVESNNHGGNSSGT